MRTATFAVPSGVMAGFADAMAERGLDNSVSGTNEDGEILVEVMYEKEETKTVDELEEILEGLKEQIEEEDEEEDEEEE
jgi:hypothetical protein